MTEVNKRFYILSGALVVVTLVLAVANLLFGSADIPFSAVADILAGREPENETWKFIVLELRLPQCITALLCGASLSVSGLMLQTVFSNPLAEWLLLFLPAAVLLQPVHSLCLVSFLFCSVLLPELQLFWE